jgi:recombinational DNA repair protein RecR
MDKYGRPPKRKQITADIHGASKKTFNCPNCTAKEDNDSNPCDTCLKNVNNYDKK